MAVSLQQEELLANAIFAFPCLYDKTTKGHKERDVLINAWNSVAEKLDFVEDGKLVCLP